MTALHDLTLSDLCRRTKSGELSARSITELMLARIDEHDDALRAYVLVMGETALAAADRLDRARAAGEPLGALHGVPIALKDLLSTVITSYSIHYTKLYDGATPRTRWLPISARELRP